MHQPTTIDPQVVTAEGWVPFDDHSGADRFQVLSPVRMRDWGTVELNRLLQRHFRAADLRRSRQRGGHSYGPEQIVVRDKVMLLTNGFRDAYNTRTMKTSPAYFANGEIGLAATFKVADKRTYLNVAFADREPLRVGFPVKPANAENVDLELAYALTVHKAQGSEFGTVVVVVPAHARTLTRELLYTAVTRAREKLILLVEGTDTSRLYELTRPERSETARRNTNLFTVGVRRPGQTAFAEHLIHRTLQGELVRSKSEVIIANLLHAAGVAYVYERELAGADGRTTIHPDFTMLDYAGEPVIWEHLGMLDRPDYRASWERRRAWYEANGFVLGENLFTSEENNTGLDSVMLDKQVTQIKDLVS